MYPVYKWVLKCNQQQPTASCICMHGSLFLITIVYCCIIMLSRSVCHSFKLNLFSSKFLPRRSSSVKMSIKNISVAEFHELLKGPDRASFQIIDVREKGELLDMALHGSDIINLPLSENEAWGQKVISGEVLDTSKPIVCMCKAGGRSLKAANFFVNDAKCADVINVLGGITAYAAEVDQSVVKKSCL